MSKAPRLIRNSGVFEELKLMGHDVTDFGDVQVQPPAKVDRESRIKHVIEFNRKVSSTISQHCPSSVYFLTMSVHSSCEIMLFGIW